MGHRRLTAEDYPAGTNQDRMEFFEVYECDECHSKIQRDNVHYFNGSVYMPSSQGHANWPLQAYICKACFPKFKNLFPGLTKVLNSGIAQQTTS